MCLDVRVVFDVEVGVAVVGFEFFEDSRRLHPDVGLCGVGDHGDFIDGYFME